MKNLKYLLLLIPFMFISSVKAESIEFNNYYDTGVSNISLQEIFKNKDYKEHIEESTRLLFEKYESDYSDIYSYYVITFQFNKYVSQEGYVINLGMYMANQKFNYYYVKDSNYGITKFEDGTEFSGFAIDGKYKYLFTSYDSISTTYDSPKLISEVGNTPASALFNIDSHLDGTFDRIYRYLYAFSSNFNPIFYTDYDLVIINNYLDSGDTYTLKNGDILPTIYKGKDFTDKGNLVEIDLNSYSYIALSLKDYNKTEAFDVSNYVKGQYCLTPLYDYGLKERKEIINQSQVERCSPYYNDFTLVRTTILKSDLENHAIYYLKSYDTSKENKVKVDSSVFNIHYITEEEKDNPILNINGTKYSTLPFDKLTDTANKSEEEGYVSGASGEIKVDWSDIFTSPLEFIKGIWTSVTQIFVVIGYFISLLPIQLQYFLYISFMFAIILGLIKIIL